MPLHLKVLVVDDDEDVCRLFKRALIKQGISKEVDYCTTLNEGMRRAQEAENEYDLILFDLIFPESTMVQTWAKITAIETPLLIVSGMPKEHIESMVGPMTKPFRDKASILSNGGLLGALIEMVYWFQGHDRMKRIEYHIQRLKELEGLS